MPTHAPAPPAVSMSRPYTSPVIRPQCQMTRSRSGLWIATCTVETPRGPVKVQAAIPNRAIELLYRLDAEVGGDGAVIGGFWNDLREGFHSVVSNRIVQVGAAAVLQVYPGVPAAVTMTALEMSSRLTESAAKGEPRAVRKVNEIRAGATRGQPAAVIANRALEHVVSSRRLAAGAISVLDRVRQGDPRARRQLETIAAKARQGNPAGVRAAQAVRVTLETAARMQREGVIPPPPPAVAARKQPPPPVVRRPAPPPPAVRAAPPPPPAVAAPRQPAPPTVREQVVLPPGARLTAVRQLGGGRREVTFQIGYEWYHPTYRASSEVRTLRDIYRKGAMSDR